LQEKFRVIFDQALCAQKLLKACEAGQAELSQILNVFGLRVIVRRSLDDAPQSLLAAVVIELKQFILVVVLEGNEGPLHHIKVHEVYPVDVRLVDFHGQRFQGKV
jgi:hypothetical protein